MSAAHCSQSNWFDHNFLSFSFRESVVAQLSLPVPGQDLRRELVPPGKAFEHW